MTMDLETGLNEALISSDHFFNNRFDEAQSILQAWSETSMYHSVGHSVLMFMEAMLTFEPKRIEAAMEAVKKCMAICSKYRKKNSITESISNIWRRPNYDLYSADEVHAELCYAEALLLKALLTFVQDESLVSFVKASLSIRSCYNLYKECEIILNTRNWTIGSDKPHFESGVHMGIGVFNIMISQLPSRIIKLLEFIGFKGNKDEGLKQLEAGSQLERSARQLLCIFTRLVYHLFVIYGVSYQDGDLNMCEQLISTQLKNYPAGFWFLFLKGRLEFVKGNFDDAMKWYIASWKSQEKWPQFHHICFWDLMWINVMKQNWNEALSYADYLVDGSHWSKTIQSYHKACIMENASSDKEKEEIDKLMRNVPLWKQRIAGKSIPMEKFCIRKAERYFSQGQILILPAFELLYVWNLFNIFGKRRELMKSCLEQIDNTLINLDMIEGKEGYTADNQALLLLMKGACLRLLDSPEEAEDCVKRVILMEKVVKDDIYLIPYAMLELALLYRRKNKRSMAYELADDARKNYAGYPLETRLHFFVHAFLMELNSEDR